MAVKSFEIRWIDDTKRYGVFATRQFAAGEMVYEEVAAMVDINKLGNVVAFWMHIQTENVSLHPTTKMDLETQTSEIVDTMQKLRNTIDTDPEYSHVMKLHDTRMKNQQVNELCNEDDLVTRRVLQVPMNLYKRTVDMNVPGSDSIVTAILQTPLQQINTFLHGMMTLHYPEQQFWGPHTSLINHGCRPNATVTRLEDEKTEDMEHQQIGRVTLRAVSDIRKDQEITTEYSPALGTFEQRRASLRWYGIAKCHCSQCDYEENLTQKRGENAETDENLQNLISRGNFLHDFYHHKLKTVLSLPPAEFFQTIYHVFANLTHENYQGQMIPKLFSTAITYSKFYNDNIRIYWFSCHLIHHTRRAYSEGHSMRRYVEDTMTVAQENHVWNTHERATGYLNLVRPFELSEADTPLVFMLNQPTLPTTYHQLTQTTEGRLESISFEDNLAAVRARTASIDADVAAAALIGEEAAAAAKKEKKKTQKKEKEKRARERKRAAKAAEEEAIAAAAVAVEEKLAARVAAVKAATVVPALPLPVGCAVAPVLVAAPSARSSPPPHHRLFRSDSAPERATVARFLAGCPLRPDPTGEDCVSEDGLEIRFGVGAGGGGEEEEEMWEWEI